MRYFPSVKLGKYGTLHYLPRLLEKFFFLKIHFLRLFLTLITNLILILVSEAYLPRFNQVLPRFSKKFFFDFLIKKRTFSMLYLCLSSYLQNGLYQLLDSYFCEFLWRQDIKRRNVEPFREILNYISQFMHPE